MKICLISDTHNKHNVFTMPDADMVIHSGDFTSMGHEHEIKNFFKWFSKLNQYKYKIVVAGNHDWLFEKNSTLAKSLVPDNVHYLEDEGVEIEGYYIYGTPVQKHFCSWAFNRNEGKLHQHWQGIPDKTDILVTHSPPYLIRDIVPYSNSHEGSPTLYQEVAQRVKPLLHVFGHIHESRGTKIIENTTYVNASVLDDSYMPVYIPIVVEINANEVDVITI